jgi:hypothetical protein
MVGGSRSIDEATRRGPGMPPLVMKLFSTTSTDLLSAPAE